MSTRQESFDKKEKRERELIKLYFDYKCNTQGNCFEVEDEDEKYFPYDATIYQSGEPKYIVETKVREQYTYEQINKWGGSFLELTKLDGILKMQKERGHNTPILYINFYKDKVVTYELPKDISQYEWELKNLQKDDHNKRPVYKHVTKLPDTTIIEVKGREQ